MNFRKVVNHKKLLYLFTFLLLMGIFFLPSQNVKAAGWEKSGWNEWRNGNEKVYVEGNKLYKSSANGKKSVLSSWSEKEYNDNEDDDLRIIGVRGKNVILGMASYTKTSKVYAVDMSKKKKKVITRTGLMTATALIPAKSIPSPRTKSCDKTDKKFEHDIASIINV